ncbi:hypothetical protein EON79_18765 [bacterium]|nr:MAG: hypothetical protein EON79_18765 [bacterium]
MKPAKIGRSRTLALMSIPPLLAVWISITFFVLADRLLLDRLLPQAIGFGMVLLLRSLLGILRS